jgi:membrane associated rhomboid family serine protease
MVRNEKAKTAALILSALIFLLLPFDARGIYNGASIIDRCLYPLFHVNIFHAFLNVWCLLSIVFYFRVSLGQILLSYAIAVMYPVDTISLLTSITAPTVGISGVCYALIGMTFYQFSDKIFFAFTTAALFLLGHLLGASNNVLHIYTLAGGLLTNSLWRYIKS